MDDKFRADCIRAARGVPEQAEGKEVHRHVHLVGRGRAKAAQVYPVPLVEAILRGVKKE